MVLISDNNNNTDECYFILKLYYLMQWHSVIFMYDLNVQTLSEAVVYPYRLLHRENRSNVIQRSDENSNLTDTCGQEQCPGGFPVCFSMTKHLQNTHTHTHTHINAAEELNRRSALAALGQNKLQCESDFMLKD